MPGQPPVSTSYEDVHEDMRLPMLDTKEKSDAPSPPPPDGIRASAEASTHPEENTVGGWRQALVLIIQHWEKALILAVLIVLIILVSVKGFTVFGDILTWFQNQNNWAGWAIFLAMYTANVSLLLPGIVLILGAGFVFGFWKGLLAVWIGGGIGQSMAFLLARYLISDLVSAMLRGKSRKWDMVDRAIELEGWKLLLLCRLSPWIPYNILNVLMASTKIHFWQFAIVSFFGIIPECALFCYMGSLTENVSAIVAGDARPHGKVTYILAGISVFFLLLTAIWASLIIRRALKRADASLKEDGAAADDSGADVEAGAANTLLSQTELRSSDAAAGSEANSQGNTEGTWPYSPPSLRGKEIWQGPPTPHSESSDPWDEELRQWPPSTFEANTQTPVSSSRTGSREIEAVQR
ncbi:probable Golgi apparatus membrane protein tvp38 [Coccomyxa sp. Obi]|nr:probable Golgi apparatus membrane protein tvp38 [Coccomyxa sp. Obi]